MGACLTPAQRGLFVGVCMSKMAGGHGAGAGPAQFTGAARVVDDSEVAPLYVRAQRDDETSPRCAR